MYASLFEVSGALHLDVFEQPEQKVSIEELTRREEDFDI
jgi:hypothetical protein